VSDPLVITGPSRKDGPVFLRSTRLVAAGFRHGFSTRVGGVSEAPFRSLNLGIALTSPHRDEPARVEENLRRFAEATGLADRTVIRVNQVHGCATLDGDRADPHGPRSEADAIVVRGRDRAALIRHADCVPILLAAPRSRAVAAVHAGWRGLVAGVIEEAVRALGDPPAEILAAIGPSIGVEAYEVGADVAEAFAAAGLAGAIDRSRRASSAGPRVDCHRAAEMLLLRAGLRAESLDGTPLCTVERADWCFSHRRDGPATGRLAAIIAP
jgi:YfiH family protein